MGGRGAAPRRPALGRLASKSKLIKCRADRGDTAAWRDGSSSVSIRSEIPVLKSSGFRRPRWCAQCGEPLFETREVGFIQQALVALDRESQKLVGAS